MTMEKKTKRKILAADDDAEGLPHQKQQQQQEERDELQEPEQQPQPKREKRHKKIRQQEVRRLQDANRAARDINALQQTLNPSVSQEDQEPPTMQTLDLPAEPNEADDEQDAVDLHRKNSKSKKQQNQSLIAFSAAMTSLLAQEGEGGSAVLSQDSRIFDAIKTQQTEERIRKEIIAERRHKRSLTHRLPSPDDAEIEANLKRLATKGTVSFLNVLMAARRREAAEAPHKKKTRKHRRFMKKPSDKSKLIASKK